MYPKLFSCCFALLLSACTAKTPPAQCADVSCRPQPENHQLVIWWQADLRTGAADFTQVALP
ncbi:type III secretion protein HrpT [Lonsdalea iberica]|uniref:Type III secretion protein HrpT n=1 Tax=Lonsdalea iberica TaxID=1082703 RepID=A0A1X3S0C5_9GAMM|nr:HrpT family type III secretion system protein [Lonsdalea iberica]OSN05758.1 type III secretion protein HrpT [Lonsdalea iberica]OSN07923.1 type III secretion protein HrpT [Lonsdalea iberica]